MIEAYIDESGIHQGSTACVIAGYFGRTSHWRHFDGAWLDVLSKYDFPLERFHAQEQVKQERHRPMLLELAHTVSRYTIYPVSMGLVVDDFDEFSLEAKRWLTGGSKHGASGAPSKPYFLPFQLLLMKVCDYAEAAGSKAHFFFGLNAEFSQYAKALFAHIKETRLENPASLWRSKHRLGDIAFRLAKETPAMQAADLLAHLSWQRMRECAATNEWDIPASELLALCLKNTRSPRDHGYQNGNAMLATFDNAAKLSNLRKASFSLSRQPNSVT